MKIELINKLNNFNKNIDEESQNTKLIPAKNFNLLIFFKEPHSILYFVQFFSWLILENTSNKGDLYQRILWL